MRNSQKPTRSFLELCAICVRLFSSCHSRAFCDRSGFNEENQCCEG